MSYEMKNNWSKLYNSIYCILLKAIYIQFSNEHKSIDKKMGLFCDFIDSELCSVMIPEIIMVKRYFEKGNQYKFFGKIQKGRDDLIITMKNMVWDLMHLRVMEIGTIQANSPIIDVFIPYMFTYDKRLLEVRSCYELNALAINKKDKWKYTLYANDNEIKSYIEDLYQSQRVAERRNRIVNVDLLRLSVELEEQLSNLY